jgi:hypothetical protein
VKQCASSILSTTSLGGATGTRCQTWLDGLVQGGGTAWCHGGNEGRPGKVNTLILVLIMGRRQLASVTSGACTMLHVEGLPDWFELWVRYWAA